MTVTVIDPVSDYAELMESLFDFAAIRAMFEGGFRMVFDSMLAVTGPYAKKSLKRDYAKHGTVINGEPEAMILAAVIPTPTQSGRVN